MSTSTSHRIRSLFDIRRRRTRLLCVLGAAALITTAAPSAVANLSGSSFEGSDGNLIVNTSGNKDWVSSTINRVRGDELHSGKLDNSFGQGTKEDDADVTVVTGSIPPQKSDLTRFYVGNELANGANYLYLAWERSNVLGSANMDFEINKVAQPDLTTTGAKTLNRSEGDLLVTFDFGGSGSPVLGLLEWVTDGAASQCFSTNALPCWGNRVNLSAAGEAEGAVNSVSVTDSIAGVTLPAGTFGEAAINLTAAGVLPAGSCDGFASAFLKSRSSASFPAEVKDFIAPQPVNISNCVQPTLTTAQSWVPNDSVKITATGGGNLAGTAHFALYSGSTCSGTAIYDSSTTTPADIPVSGASPQTVSSLNTTAVAAGNYSWSVSYDSTNALQKDIAASCKEVSSLTVDNDNTD